MRPGIPRSALCLIGMLAGTAVLLAFTPTASAATIVSGPLAPSVNYLTPEVTMSPGETVTFTNFDFPAHDVTSEDTYRPPKRCRRTRRGKRKCRRPPPRLLFRSALIGFGESATVNGTHRLRAGRRYGFFCSIHPSMEGTITVRR